MIPKTFDYLKCREEVIFSLKISQIVLRTICNGLVCLWIVLRNLKIIFFLCHPLLSINSQRVQTTTATNMITRRWRSIITTTRMTTTWRLTYDGGTWSGGWDRRRRREGTLYNPEAASAPEVKGLRSGHCEGRCIKRTFDDFDKSEDVSNNGARDRERRSKDKYKKKEDNRAAIWRRWSRGS